MLALGMIVEFDAVLSRPYYEGKYVDGMEQISARRRVRILFKAFCHRYATRLGDEWVYPSYIYKLSVLKFALGLVSYRKNTLAGKKDICTETKLLVGIEKHIRANHTDLLPAFQRLKQNADGWLVWDGPAIHIEERAKAERIWAKNSLVEARQHTAYPIYFDDKM